MFFKYFSMKLVENVCISRAKNPNGWSHDNSDFKKYEAGVIILANPYTFLRA